jgi:hypothetical protein
MSGNWGLLLAELVAPAMVVAWSPVKIVSALMLVLNSPRPKPTALAFVGRVADGAGGGHGVVHRPTPPVRLDPSLVRRQENVGIHRDRRRRPTRRCRRISLGEAGPRQESARVVLKIHADNSAGRSNPRIGSAGGWSEGAGYVRHCGGGHRQSVGRRGRGRAGPGVLHRARRLAHHCLGPRLLAGGWRPSTAGWSACGSGYSTTKTWSPRSSSH